MAGPASASEAHRGPRVQTVTVTSEASGLHFSSTHVNEGTITFKISTTNPNGIGLTLLRPQHGASLAKIAAGAAEEFNPATGAAGTRDLEHDAVFYGLADTAPGSPESATVRLNEGTYYAIDTSSEAPPTAASFVKFTVVKARHGDFANRAALAHSATVLMTANDRFVVWGHLRSHGSVLVANVADTLHFMSLSPVAPGTTDAQVQAYFDSGSQDQPPFALNGPSASTDVLSPGKQLVLSYSLPKGTYVMLCFVSDDETGMPHALMGMHKLVQVG